MILVEKEIYVRDLSYDFGKATKYANHQSSLPGLDDSNARALADAENVRMAAREEQKKILASLKEHANSLYRAKLSRSIFLVSG